MRRPIAHAIGGSLLLLLALGAAAQSTSDMRAEQAVALYDAGDYAAAQVLLEELDAEGLAGGTLLYRLSFCRGRARDTAGEREALDRAVAALEQEVGQAASLEVPFYLANAYRNLRRSADAAGVARRATERLEQGGYPPPAAPLEMFRTAKLYADQSATDKAVEWYRRTLEAIAASGRAYPGNESWARRYIGDVSYAAGRYDEAAEQYRALLPLSGDSPAAYDRLASTLARAGNWEEAARLWDQVVRARPAEADRARYCSKLAGQAQEIGTLPDVGPDGRAWAEYSNEGLEVLMKGQSELVPGLLAEANEGGDRDAIAARLAQARAFFVAGALEYALRNRPIRATAFQGGYAPFIFHARRWKLEPVSKRKPS